MCVCGNTGSAKTIIFAIVQHIIDYRVDENDGIENLRSIPPPMFTLTEGVLSYG